MIKEIRKKAKKSLSLFIISLWLLILYRIS
nr:MAG TPA: hypothetical protein [Caudoviricetes sp.]DAP12077.1 MAG TPA: hypothetical protein [Caudoviricetes sp.]DAV33274.1 MAG TPA: hypothetical protein [Caudoviricetes sp.]